MSTYDYPEHRHQYAVWTAARAVQRNFANTSSIKSAIESSGLRAFAEDNKAYTTELFDQLHKLWAKQLITSLQRSGVLKSNYGRAAKIIAIYLKTAVIICNSGKCNKSEVIHPPIDSILLTTIAANNPEMNILKTTRWTFLDEARYWNLVSMFRQSSLPFNWRLEEYWKAT